MILEGFDSDEFLRRYWQREPLLIKHAGKPFVDPIDPDELAGFACEAAVESRIVSRHSDDNWQVCHGPFDSDRFATMGEKEWTLLVQAVDQLHPDVALLKSHFGFLPGWRIDDIMVSYACDGGGVGPHFDQYDVFLIQGMGRRSWQIGERCDSGTVLRKNTDLRLIQEFSAVQELVLESGDILYLPPRFAHHGTSQGESLCYSVGFRAPSVIELLQGYADELTATLSADQRFEDPLLWNSPTANSISTEAIEAAFEKLRAIINQNEQFTDFFGKYVTEPRYPERIHPAEPATLFELQKLIKNSPYPAVFSKNPGSRFAYFLDQGRLTLFVDGEQLQCQPDQLVLIQQLCETPWPEPLALEGSLRSDLDQELITGLVAQGSLFVSFAADR